MRSRLAIYHTLSSECVCAPWIRFIDASLEFGVRRCRRHSKGWMLGRFRCVSSCFIINSVTVLHGTWHSANREEAQLVLNVSVELLECVGASAKHIKRDVRFNLSCVLSYSIIQ